MTSYTDIFDRFALKSEDFVLLQLNDDDVIQACLNWMLAALPKIRKMTSDLTDRDDEIMEFNCDLTETEIEVIANMMVAEWLQPQVYSQKNINQMYGGKEEKYYSQASHLSELKLLLQRKQEEVDRLIKKSKYEQFADSINEENDNG